MSASSRVAFDDSKEEESASATTLEEITTPTFSNVKLMNNKLDESIFKFSPNETHTTNLVPFNIACETTDAAVKNSNSGTISYSASPALPGSNANNNTSFKAEKKSALHCNYYPIGSLLSIAYHNDGHYYDCTVKKHYPNTNKQSDSRKQWLFVHFTPSVSIPQQRWIDVNCIPSLRINMSDDIFTLQDDSNNRSRKNIPCSKSNITDGIDLLGKEVVVEWNSKQWRGKVTKVMKDNDHFVFIEYDNGDQSWCDLQNENSWATVPEHNESSSSLLHARTRSSKIVEKEEKGDDISYSNRNNSHITAATTTTTTTNNKKQKYYHDHYQQQPLVTEEQEEKRMHKARKEEYYNTIPSQSRSPPALHIEYPDQNDILFGRGWDVSFVVFAFVLFFSARLDTCSCSFRQTSILPIFQLISRYVESSPCCISFLSFFGIDSKQAGESFISTGAGIVFD